MQSQSNLSDDKPWFFGIFGKTAKNQEFDTLCQRTEIPTVCCQQLPVYEMHIAYLLANAEELAHGVVLEQRSWEDFERILDLAEKQLDLAAGVRQTSTALSSEILLDGFHDLEAKWREKEQVQRAYWADPDAWKRRALPASKH